jgi:hypothetical protein
MQAYLEEENLRRYQVPSGSPADRGIDGAVPDAFVVPCKPGRGLDIFPPSRESQDTTTV